MQRQWPTDYYDEQLKSMDAGLVSSIATRQRLSKGQPGFPKIEYLEQWAQQYDIPEAVLYQVFAVLFYWDTFRNHIQPDRFERFVSVMALELQDDLLVIVPAIRQYNNCSVVSVQLQSPRLKGVTVEMTVDIAGYQCYASGGGGSAGHWYQDIVVTPIIPDVEAKFLDITVHIETLPAVPRPGPESASKPIAPTSIRLRGK